FLNYLEFQAEDSIEDLEIELIYEKSRPNSLPEDIPQSTPRNRPRGTKKIIWSIAASIVIAAITWLAVIQLESSHPEEHWSVMKTEKGERKFFKLTDGTEIWLNNESTLKVKDGYGKRDREIKLIGEAYFDVAKNEKLPLHVHTEQTT